MRNFRELLSGSEKLILLPVRLSIVLVGVFLLLQCALWSMGGTTNSRDMVPWWVALSTLASDRGFFHIWSPYPPVFPFLHYCVFLLSEPPLTALRSLLAQTGGDPSAHAVIQAFMGKMGTLWLLGNALLLAAHVPLIVSLRRMCSLSGGWIAACAFLLFNHSPWSWISLGIWSDQFEFLPSFLLLISIFLLLRHRWALSAFTTGIAIMTKIYPGILLPIVWWRPGVGRRWSAVVLLTIGLVVLPFLMTDRKAFLSTFQWMSNRSGWESVWSFETAARPLGIMPPSDQMRFVFGLTYYDALLELREGEYIPGFFRRETEEGIVFAPLDAPEQVFPEGSTVSLTMLKSEDGTLALILQFLTIALLLIIGRCFRTNLSTPIGLIRGTLLGILILLFFSKGFSSYFIFWLSPLLFILYAPLPASLLWGSLLIVGNIALLHLDRGLPFFWTGIFLRHGILLLLIGDQIIRLRHLQRPEILASARENSCEQ